MTTDAKTKAFLIVEAALNKKALNLTLLEMKEITSFTDYFFSKINIDHKLSIMFLTQSFNCTIMWSYFEFSLS